MRHRHREGTAVLAGGINHFLADGQARGVAGIVHLDDQAAVREDLVLHSRAIAGVGCFTEGVIGVGNGIIGRRRADQADLLLGIGFLTGIGAGRLAVRAHILQIVLHGIAGSSGFPLGDVGHVRRHRVSHIRLPADEFVVGTVKGAAEGRGRAARRHRVALISKDHFTVHTIGVGHGVEGDVLGVVVGVLRNGAVEGCFLGAGFIRVPLQHLPGATVVGHGGGHSRSRGLRQRTLRGTFLHADGIVLQGNKFIAARPHHVEIHRVDVLLVQHANIVEVEGIRAGGHRAVVAVIAGIGAVGHDNAQLGQGVIPFLVRIFRAHHGVLEQLTAACRVFDIGTGRPGHNGSAGDLCTHSIGSGGVHTADGAHAQAEPTGIGVAGIIRIHAGNQGVVVKIVASGVLRIGKRRYRAAGVNHGVFRQSRHREAVEDHQQAHDPCSQSAQGFFHGFILLPVTGRLLLVAGCMALTARSRR